MPSNQSSHYACLIQEPHYQEPSTPMWVVPGTEIETTDNTCPPSGKVPSSAEEAASRERSDKNAQLPCHFPEKLHGQTSCAYWLRIKVFCRQRWEPALLHTWQTSKVKHTLHQDRTQQHPHQKHRQALRGPHTHLITRPALAHFREQFCRHFWSQNEVHTDWGVGNGQNSKHCFTAGATLW